MKKYFVTFGTGIYRKSKDRIVQEAKNMNYFDYIFGFDESIFDNVSSHQKIALFDTAAQYFHDFKNNKGIFQIT